MKATDVAKVVGATIGMVLLVIFLTPLFLAAAAYVGYFYGIIVMWLAGGVLTGVLGLSEGDIPTVLAWTFVVGSIIGVGGLKYQARKQGE